MKPSYQRRTVAMGDVHCQWTCGPDALRDFFAMVSPNAEATGRRFGDIASGTLVVVTDENVDRLHGLELPPGVPRIVVPPGESSKTLGWLAEVLRLMLDAGLDRAGTVIAFGGGVVGDLAGFAAATFMRGVRWVNVPTTLLAMVDASIGGKTGVDVDGAKNLAGAFHPPAAIVADPTVLATLPAAERADGMAEAVKQAIIGSPGLFGRLERGAFEDAEDIAAAAQVKIEIVERDPFERGERAVLNLGHTVGHGVETASGYRLSHGHAVAVGLVAETRLAERLHLAHPGLADRIAGVLGQHGLSTRTALVAADVRAGMTSDKKRLGGRLRFALPRAVGDVVYGVEVEEPVVMAVLEESLQE
jgi:3-dehydroquinate synthase